MAENTQVLFKLGSQANLNSLLTNGTTAVPNAFYVTNDTHRIYFGITDATDSSKTRVVPLNQGVITVESAKDLQRIPGQFYYIGGSNVLCVWNGSDWVHINPDTNTFVDGHTITTAAGTATNSVQITSTVEQNNGSDKSDSWSLIGGNHIKVTAGTKALTIACDLVYSLNLSSVTGGAQIELIEGTATNAGKFTIKGANGIVVGASNGNISVDGSAIKNAADNQAITDVAMVFDASGELSTTVTQKGGNTKTGGITPKITLGGNDTEYTFKNGVVDLPVYTKDETDLKLRELDAVHYKGVVTDSTPLPTTGVNIGDAWKLGIANVTYTPAPGQTASATKVGDLLIANGTEGSDGYITTSTLYWDYIPSGDDIEDTTYKGVAVKGAADTGAHGLKIVTNNSGSEEAKLTIQKGNDWIKVNSSNSSGKTNNVTIKHSEPGALSAPTPGTDTDQAAVASKTITFVSGITTDAARHITGYTLTTSKFTDTNSAVSANTVALSETTADKVVKVTNTVTTKNARGDTTSKESSYSFVSANDNIKLDANDTDKTVTFGLVWGSF